MILASDYGARRRPRSCGDTPAAPPSAPRSADGQFDHGRTVSEGGVQQAHLRDSRPSPSTLAYRESLPASERSSHIGLTDDFIPALYPARKTYAVS